jgi:hypothetical protein
MSSVKKLLIPCSKAGNAEKKSLLLNKTRIAFDS